ncbi:hypothetical protein Ga0609869_003053 [Rhodovulum iodosum]|uniref:O-antigen ligase domain-containing protein n=1 Tax=Rhodovulum iodosum TaxID=68291 RepID=A0ABV3XY59_9RHOB|nr:hypothetical protein [Rhodovulum robiginosum]RSK38361.1 hypothetical protein EJA01_02120 [Rhodovulum robiginosum]
MEIVPSTILALLAMVMLVARGTARGRAVLLALTPLGAAAAFNLPALGGASILVTDIAALTLFTLVLLAPGGLSRMAGTMRPGQPGFYLLFLALFSVVAALAFPRLFQGQTDVFSLSRGDRGIISLPLRPTNGNLTQLFRMMLGAFTFFALVTITVRRPDPGPVLAAVTLATGVHVALGWADVLSAAAGLEVLLDPIRTANYSILSESRMAGIKRMVGGFPEASAYGGYTLGLFAFWLQYLVLRRSRLAGWCFAFSTLALLRSTSSSAYVAAAAFGITFLGLSAMRSGLRAIPRRSAGLASVALVVVWLGTLTLFGAYELVNPVTDYLDGVLFTKLESDSGIERMSWNDQAFRNFVETSLMGAGLGSMRASNWLLACLGSFGLIGTTLYLAFLGKLASAPARTGLAERDVVIRSLKAGALALFLSALLTGSTPDLGLFFFAIAGLLAGLSRGGMLESQALARTRTEAIVT